MTCEHATRAELSGYADGELPAAERAWWDQHLGECAACRAELERIEALRTAIRRELPALEPAPAFRDAVARMIRGDRAEAGPTEQAVATEEHGLRAGRPERRAVPRPAPPERRRSAERWRGWEAAIAATLLFAVGLAAGRLSGGGDREPVAAQVVATHVRSLEVDHLLDVASSEHHVVKPWFAGKLDFSPPVPDLAADSFPLIGARVDYVAGRQVAALVYRRGPHRINLLVWPAAASSPASGCERDGTIVRQGFNLSHGRAAGMELWAISDLNRQELEEFAARWQRAAAPGEKGCG
jgi:anti-sigma factor RsiW